MSTYVLFVVIYALFSKCGQCATLQPEVVTMANLSGVEEDFAPPTVAFDVNELDVTESTATVTQSMTTVTPSDEIATLTAAVLSTASAATSTEGPIVDENVLQRNLASHVSSNSAPYNNSALSYYNYPFHHFALPECATQQVCNAVYTRLDRINALCACPGKTGDPCSISFSSDDAHTIELVTDNSGRALTLIKTCEPIVAVRECRGSRDWALLALQNVRTGKSHYLVVCRCVHSGVLEGPIAHENPPYAKIPGIRVYGMICVRDTWSRNNQRQQRNRTSREVRNKKLVRRRNLPAFPWNLVHGFAKNVDFN